MDRFLREQPASQIRHDACRQPVIGVATTRRAFLGSAAASGAAFMVNGPLAFAASSRSGSGSRAAGLVISALATDPSNGLPEDRNWTSVAETRFGQGLDDRRAIFDGLRDEIPDLELLTPDEIAGRLAELLLPGYQGPRSITRAEAEAELAAIQANVSPSVVVPSQTGAFQAPAPAPAAVVAQLQPPSTSRELRRSRAVVRTLNAVDDVLARGGQGTVMGVGVPF
jgi:hypothetical protein